MAATMRKRDGKYIVTVHQDGKRQQRTFTVKREAEREMNRCNHALNAGVQVKPDQPREEETLNHFIDLWFELKVCGKKALGTYQRYEGIYRNKIKNDIGKRHIDTLVRTELITYFQDLQLERRTRSDIEGRICVINSALKLARDRGKGPGLSQELVKSLYDNQKREKPDIKPFTVEEKNEILMNTNKAEYALVLLLFSTGMRLGEALGLNWDSINTLEGYILIQRSFRNGHLKEGTKNNEDRTIPVSEDVLAWLKTCRKTRNENRLKKLDGEAVFTRAGKRLSQNSFRYAWKRILERAGIDHRKVHTTRHTVATDLLNAGHPPKLVAEILGHRVETLLSTYSHLLEGSDDKKRDMLLALNAVGRGDRQQVPDFTSVVAMQGNE